MFLKKHLPALGVLFLIFTLLLAPDSCIYASKEGLLLWFNKILPSLLPFIILINILSGLNILKGISSFSAPLTHRLWKLPGSSLFVFIMGLIAGYPMGAKVVRQSLDDGTLSPSEAQKLLCFSNNCGPLFIIGTVGTLMLKNLSAGYFLFFIHLLSSLLMAYIFSFYHPSSVPASKTRAATQTNLSRKFSAVFNESVQNAMDTIVYIGGYIIFFSVLTHLLTTSPLVTHFVRSSIVLNLSAGLLELSNGANSLSTNSIALEQVLPLLALLIGFGGLCVHAQASYILGECPFSLVPYLLAKIMQGLLSFLLASFFYPFFSTVFLKSAFKTDIKWLLLLVFLVSVFIVFVKSFSDSSSIKHVSAYQRKQSFPYK